VSGADEGPFTAASYRQRANEALARARTTKDAADKQFLLELASSWLELAQRAEETGRLG